MIKEIATRGYSIGTVAFVALRGYVSGNAPPPVTSFGGSWLAILRRRFRR